MADYTINGIYQGGYSSLDPDKAYTYGDIFTGYHVPAASLGAPTKPDTANQIQQVNMLMSQGIVPIEVGVLSPEVFDQIPKTHFKEMNRMAKLTGADISVHAPMIEASGIGQGGFEEINKKQAEEQLWNVIDKSAELNDKGGIIVNIHGAGTAGQGVLPGVDYRKEDGKKVEDTLVIVNKEDGKIASAVSFDEMYDFRDPTKKGQVEFERLTPRDKLRMANNTEWSNSVSKVSHDKAQADKLLNENLAKIPEEVMRELAKNPEKINMLPHNLRVAWDNVFHGQQYLRDVEKSLGSLFDRAYKLAKMDEDKSSMQILEDATKEYYEEGQKGGYMAHSNAVQGMLQTLSSIHPEIFQPLEDFAAKKSADTFANVALKAYDKYKDKAPVMSVENMFPGMAFSYGKELDNLIKTTKNKFVEKAVSQGVMSESAAQKQADKMIGVTLDMGHLNIMRKKGFEKEDLLKEVNEIAKHIKHVHVTDNFGYSDSHLPPGMGNVPIKDILEKLEKEGKGDVKKIVEAGGFVQHFGTSPLPYTLEGMGAGMFQDPAGTGQQPYWNQSMGLYQSYSGGFGMMLPQTNYSMFGAGFSQLPTELGGIVGGGRGSRMSGRPME